MTFKNSLKKAAISTGLIGVTAAAGAATGALSGLGAVPGAMIAGSYALWSELTRLKKKKKELLATGALAEELQEIDDKINILTELSRESLRYSTKKTLGEKTMDKTGLDLIQNALEENPATFKNVFDELMREKIGSAIEARRAEMAASWLNTPGGEDEEPEEETGEEDEESYNPEDESEEGDDYEDGEEFETDSVDDFPGEDGETEERD